MVEFGKKGICFGEVEGKMRSLGEFYDEGSVRGLTVLYGLTLLFGDILMCF